MFKRRIKPDAAVAVRLQHVIQEAMIKPHQKMIDDGVPAAERVRIIREQKPQLVKQLLDTYQS